VPPAATTRGLDEGTRAEVRVAQAWFWDGHYVRRGIDLQHRFGAEVSTVTDLDVLGYSLESSLKHHKYIGEVKTGKSNNTPRPLDRALWMRGLREIIAAEGGEVTTAFKVSASVRDSCRRLGVTVQHFDDLAAREIRLQIAQFNDVGSQGDSIASIRKEVQAFVKSDRTLERAYWFLVSEVWFLEPFDALKRTLGLIRELGKVWPPETHQDAMQAARWFFAEAISIATLNLAIVTGSAVSMDARTFEETAKAQLASGDIPSYAIRNISDRIDEYIGKILTSIDAPAEIKVSAMGAFLPVPPEYAEPLLELVSRLATEPVATARLPRQLDAVLFERLVRRRNLSPNVVRRLGLSANTERLIRLVAAFLRGQFALPGPVDKVLTTPLFEETPQADAGAQPSLFNPGSGNSDAASDADILRVRRASQALRTRLLTPALPLPSPPIALPGPARSTISVPLHGSREQRLRSLQPAPAICPGTAHPAPPPVPPSAERTLLHLHPPDRARPDHSIALLRPDQLPR
jgi:hypothetical protein